MALFGANGKQLLDEVKKYLDEGNYEAAADAADRISVRRLKTASEFNLLGRAYKKNEDYLQAKKMLEHSYAMRCSRVVLLDLMDCCLKTGELEEAEKYFDEYHKLSPEDKATLYVYRYKIEKRKGREYHLLVSILEELKAVEYIEEYAYELAKLYHKTGKAAECMDECRDIILWFGAGAVVERAKALLAYYKGELSLEDIKAAGERYVTKQQEQQEQLVQMLEETAGAEAAGKEAVGAEVTGREAAGREAAGREAAGAAAGKEVTGREVIYSAAGEEESGRGQEFFIKDENNEPKEEELPEIDLSGMGFEEAEEAVREEQELFVPFYEEGRIENAKLERLLREKGVSILEEVKNFARINQVHKQLVKSLELVLAERENAYFVITGERKTGKTTLAFSLVRLLYRLGIVKYDRTATIHAVQLNQISMADYQEKLKNCNLIIESAGGMTQETIEDVLRFSEGRRGSICVILEDSTRNLNRFLRGREELNRLFNNRIHLGKYGTKELLGFAYDYIQKEDYAIDRRAAEVLSNKIDEIVRSYGDDERLLRTLDAAADAVASAERRNSEILLGMARQGKFQKGNYLVITPEDIST